MRVSQTRNVRAFEPDAILVVKTPYLLCTLDEADIA